MSKGLGLSTSSVINLSKAPFSYIFKPLTYFMNEDNDGKDYNSIKFEPKDLHYVRSKDLVLYEKIINKIKASRAIKKVLEGWKCCRFGRFLMFSKTEVVHRTLFKKVQLAYTWLIVQNLLSLMNSLKSHSFPFKELSEHTLRNVRLNWWKEWKKIYIWQILRIDALKWPLQ